MCLRGRASSCRWVGCNYVDINVDNNVDNIVKTNVDNNVKNNVET